MELFNPTLTNQLRALLTPLVFIIGAGVYEVSYRINKSRYEHHYVSIIAFVAALLTLLVQRGQLADVTGQNDLGHFFITNWLIIIGLMFALAMPIRHLIMKEPEDAPTKRRVIGLAVDFSLWLVFAIFVIAGADSMMG